MRLMKFANAIVDFFQADRIRVPHGAAAISGKPIPVEINDVDVYGAQGVALFQDSRAFIYERVDQAIHNFVLADLALWDARFCGPLAHELRDFWIWDRAAIFVVFVPTRAGLLPIASHLAKTISCKRLADARFLQMPILLADAPADIQAREVPDSQRTHRHSEFVQRVVNSLDRGTLFQQKH